MRPHAPIDPSGNFNPAAFCPACRYALDPWMPRCPECGSKLAREAPSAAGRAWRTSAHGFIAAQALLYSALLLGLCW